MFIDSTLHNSVHGVTILDFGHDESDSGLESDPKAFKKKRTKIHVIACQSPPKHVYLLEDPRILHDE